jgi:voltage-gated potassium channel
MAPTTTLFRIYALLIGLIIIVGVPGFMLAEELTPIDAFYFCVVTIATVGYGDIHPVTVPGKILALFVIIIGVGSFVGLVVNSLETLLNRRERQARLKKLNLLIGAFFSEVGMKLLVRFSRLDPEIEEIRHDLIVSGEWTDAAFKRVSASLQGREYRIDMERADLKELREFLYQRRDFLLRLLENPMVFEQEQFTEALQAIFHLAEELGYRGAIEELPETDLQHLSSDMKRSYRLVSMEWLDYMQYLKESYPYLFSLAMRTNPFDRYASPVVE